MQDILLRQKTHLLANASHEGPVKLGVQYMRLMSENNLIVFLSDDSSFEFDTFSRGWRQVSIQSGHEAIKQIIDSSDTHTPGAPLKELSSVIEQLEH
jgi:hypothetical protein